MQLDHVTLRTSELAKTKAFFMNLFDMAEGPRPAAIQRIPGHWLYVGGAPILHLIGGSDSIQAHSATGWDHAAFRLSGYDAFRAKLERLSIPHSLMDLPDLGERRIFLRAPGGPLIETVFHETADELH